MQGPYRLRGNDSGGIIIILSGTERVFIDGLLLVRGQENDYVIDYNTAEDHVHCETADHKADASRWNSSTRTRTTHAPWSNSIVRGLGKSTLRFNVYTQQDHRNQPLRRQLSDEERLVLREAGDDPLLATVPGVDSTGFADDQVLYQRLDSLGYFPVFRYNTEPRYCGLADHTFTQVGAGLGDYVQQEFTPNGRVFRWVAPDTVNGVLVRRGDHAPVRVLVTPGVDRLGHDRFRSHPFYPHQCDGGTHLHNEDRNTFSQADQADDQGYGLMAHGEHAIPISAKPAPHAPPLARCPDRGHFAQELPFRGALPCC